jgi:hypothetical protein
METTHQLTSILLSTWCAQAKTQRTEAIPQRNHSCTKSMPRTRNARTHCSSDQSSSRNKVWPGRSTGGQPKPKPNQQQQPVCAERKISKESLREQTARLLCRRNRRKPVDQRNEQVKRNQIGVCLIRDWNSLRVREKERETEQLKTVRAHSFQSM